LQAAAARRAAQIAEGSAAAGERASEEAQVRAAFIERGLVLELAFEIISIGKGC